MSNLCGCNHLVHMLIIFLFFFVGVSMAEEGSQLFGSYSREDMVQIAGYGEEKLSTVLITGLVQCEACLHDHHDQDQAPLHAWPVSGALVGVNCHIDGEKRKSSWVHVVTDEFGDFSIDLPSNLHSIPDLEKSCRVKVLRVPRSSMCQPAYVKRHKGLRLSSIGNGIRTYTTGKIRFQHSDIYTTEACPRNKNAKTSS